jgi:hypothetical protein
LYETTVEYSEATKAEYYREMKSKFNLDSRKVDKMNVKSCTFMGLPIICQDTGQTWGVILIDAIKPLGKLENIARNIELIANHYTPFFTEAVK